MIGLELYRTTHHAGRALFHALAALGTARTTPPRDVREAAHRLAAALGAIARAHELAVTVRGEVPRGTALIVANHVSYLDPLAILPVCPAAPLAKAEVEAWPVIGAIGRALGVVFVDRPRGPARARALRRLHALLAAGVPVLNFPEGTTTHGDRVLQFARGSFGIAQRLGVPVVPLAIRYRDPELAWCDDASFVPHYLKMAAQRRIEIDLVFGAALSLRAHELPEDLAARARHAIARNLRSDHAATGVRVPASRPDPVLPPARVA